MRLKNRSLDRIKQTHLALSAPFCGCKAKLFEAKRGGTGEEGRLGSGTLTVALWVLIYYVGRLLVQAKKSLDC